MTPLTGLNASHDGLSTRFNIDVTDAHVSWAVATNALERIDELRYDSGPLQSLPKIDVAVLYFLRWNSRSLRKAIVSCVGDSNDEARQHQFEGVLRL